MIANRFQKVLNVYIDSSQIAFVPGRLISDNVLLAYEILHTFGQKKSGRKYLMALKLDISKAYNRMEWKFLRVMMDKMSFAVRWVDMIVKCNSLVEYTIIINGRMGIFFWPSRGLRQWGPFSPFFLIYSEGLSSLMRLVMREKRILGAKASRNGPQIFHLFFADDCDLFGKATMDGANFLKGILDEYGACSSNVLILINLQFSSVRVHLI